MSDSISKSSTAWNVLTSKKAIKNLDRLSWGGIPLIHANHNYQTTGDRGYYWVDYMRDHYFKDGFAGDTLCLGCGAGNVDRILKEHKFCFSSFTGVDLNPQCIEHARKLADEINLSPKTKYFVADLNRYNPPENSYDFIYFFHSLHHIESLESLLSSCAAALRPGGLLMVNEYVGPTRFQLSELQLKIANDILSLLPDELRYDLAHENIKNKIRRKTVEEIIASDPSEAVRSADIEPSLKRYFDIIDEKNWGGTLNFFIFENIAGNFDSSNLYHNAIVELLICHENTLIKQGVLPSDFKFYMGRSKIK